MKISVHIKICCTFHPVFNLVFPNDKCNLQGHFGKSVKNKKYVEIEEKENHIPPLRYINGIFGIFSSGLFSLF